MRKREDILPQRGEDSAFTKSKKRHIERDFSRSRSRDRDDNVEYSREWEDKPNTRRRRENSRDYHDEQQSNDFTEEERKQLSEFEGETDFEELEEVRALKRKKRREITAKYNAEKRHQSSSQHSEAPSLEGLEPELEPEALPPVIEPIVGCELPLSLEEGSIDAPPSSAASEGALLAGAAASTPPKAFLPSPSRTLAALSIQGPKRGRDEGSDDGDGDGDGGDGGDNDEYFENNGEEEEEEGGGGGDGDGDQGRARSSSVAEARAAEEHDRHQLSSVPVPRLDIFSLSPPPQPTAATNGGTGADVTTAAAGANPPLLQSERGDSDGYYKPCIGELVCERYRVLGVLGKGVFSCVLKCMDTGNEPGNPQQQQHENREEEEEGDGGQHDTVAVKVVRNNDVMRRAAAGEIAILKTLASADPDGKRFCVRMLSHSTHLGHVVIVFEAYAMNLREALHKFGKNVGITIQAVRMYGRQLLVALRMLKEHRIVHADLKLDNILISGDLNRVKICDFGSAFTEGDGGGVGCAPYRVSRFYRAPEVILGLPQPSCAIDLWAVAVCLFELYTGKVMFPGCTNNDMMRLMLAAKGRLPHKVIKQHLRSYAELGLTPHFDDDSLMFRQQQVASINCSTTGSSKRLSDRLVEIPLLPRETQSVWAMVQASTTSSSSSSSSSSSPAEAALVAQLADLLDKCLVLNRAKRCSVDEALEHQFLGA